mmetsp:Transcript_80403/g.130262  ORF Transcript_80403/g.130262 Transcript_80403/m.130262 type:complete len:109 (-) Transcript_80403:238-564(-)
MDHNCETRSFCVASVCTFAPSSLTREMIDLAGVPCADAVDSESASRIESRLRQRLQRANQTSEEQIRLLKTVFTARRRELFAALDEATHTRNSTGSGRDAQCPMNLTM